MSWQKIDFTRLRVKPVYVGELGPSWQFPSDHFPIGLSVGHFHIASWNVLHKKYIFQIERNGQGLGESLITKDNISIDDDSSLTLRELQIIHFINEMINHPTHPRSLIALQEVSEELIFELQKSLPERWEVISPNDHFDSQQFFLYDKEVFTFLNMDSIQYFPKKNKRILSLSLIENLTGQTYHFIQTHTPGGDKHLISSSDFFAQKVLESLDFSNTTILMGDMNCLPEMMQNRLEIVSHQLNLENQPFKHIPINYPTSINSSRTAECIDNFFIYQPQDSDESVLSNDADTFPNELQSSLKLFSFRKRLF